MDMAAPVPDTLPVINARIPLVMAGTRGRAT